VSVRAEVLLAALATAGCASIPLGRSAVDSVQVQGAHRLDARDVTDKLATAESPRFALLFEGVVYDYSILDGATLQRDLARVERVYRGRGFFDVHARAARVIHTSSDHVRVEIVVDEGLPTVSRRLVVEGLDGVPKTVADAARAAAMDALPAGARFDEGGYRNAQTAMTRALTDHGYAYATVHATAQVDLTAHAIDYTFSVHPGLAATLGAIHIVGLDPDGAGPRPQEIGEAPLRRVMRLRSGEPFSQGAIDSATQALLDLEVFSAVEITPTLSDPPARVVPLTVRVDPAKLRALQLGGGFELDEIKTEVHALVGWEDHDFLGDLRDFSVELKPGAVLFPTRIDNFVGPDHVLPEERLRLQFRQPGFFDPHTTAFVRPEVNVYPLLVAPDPDPSQPVVGYVEPKGAVGLERRFGTHFFASLGQNLQGEIPFAYTTPLGQPPPDILLSYPQLVTTLDLRDDPVRPHAGFYASNDIQIAGGPFGGTATDVRVQPEVRGYLPIARGVTFAARASVGFLFASNYGSYVQNQKGGLAPTAPAPLAYADRDIEIVYFRGFFSGGPSTNRGFPLRGVAPHGIIPFLNPANAASQVALNCAPGEAGTSFDTSLCSVPLGGFSLWEASAEVRFDVSGPLGAAVFCDSGDVSAKQADLRFTYLHLSCGVGGRYDTPVGAIRLDMGYRIQPLQVLGFASETDAAAADPTVGTQPTLFGNPASPGSGIPATISFGIGEAF
jgi:outer membrane protein insertion porin family/translocation and assembly module TamA